MRSVDAEAGEWVGRACPHCRYDLRGIEGDTCPECGGRVDDRAFEEMGVAGRGEVVSNLFLAAGLQAALFAVMALGDEPLQIAARWLSIVPPVVVVVSWVKYVRLGRYLPPDGNPRWAIAFGNVVLLGFALLGLYAFTALIVLGMFGIGSWFGWV